MSGTETAAQPGLRHKHLLGLEDYSAEEIHLILDTAESFLEVLERPIKKVPTLRGITVVNLFFENSTRTRISFEMAEKRLSADTVNFSASTSSTQKGETLRDTAANIEAMKIDAVVMRHSAPGSCLFLSRCLDSVIINAGDGAHEHPTQALLDLLTLRRHLGSLEGKRVTLVGDILHSRVALSNIHGLARLGAKVQVCGPATLIPRHIQELGVEVFWNVEEAMENSDVLNVLRIQLERHNAHRQRAGRAQQRSERPDRPRHSHDGWLASLQLRQQYHHQPRRIARHGGRADRYHAQRAHADHDGRLCR